MIDKDSILRDLKKIGISKGDHVLVTADLLNVGYFNKSRKQTLHDWLEILRESVGEAGTVVCVAYSKYFFRFKKNDEICFHRYAQVTSGSLSEAFLKCEDAKRSTHPTNSILAIGSLANYLCENHTEKSKSYSWTKDLALVGGKHLMLGTIDRKNAPAGFHFAQELIGETMRTPGVGFIQTYYIKNGTKKTFTRWDAGGCSGSGYKMFDYLTLKNAVIFGTVGKSFSALIDINKSIDVAKDLLINNRPFMVCDNRLCLFCRGRWVTSKWSVIIFYFKFILNKSFKLLLR